MSLSLWASMRRELAGCNACTHCHHRAMAALRRIDARELVVREGKEYRLASELFAS